MQVNFKGSMAPPCSWSQPIPIIITTIWVGNRIWFIWYDAASNSANLSFQTMENSHLHEDHVFQSLHTRTGGKDFFQILSLASSKQLPVSWRIYKSCWSLTLVPSLLDVLQFCDIFRMLRPCGLALEGKIMERTPWSFTNLKDQGLEI